MLLAMLIFTIILCVTLLFFTIKSNTDLKDMRVIASRETKSWDSFLLEIDKRFHQKNQKQQDQFMINHNKELSEIRDGIDCVCDRLLPTMEMTDHEINICIKELNDIISKIDKIVCPECGGSGEITGFPENQPCWKCNEKEYNHEV